MVLGWDFTHTDEMGVERQTVTSIDLLAEATYPLSMHEIIESADAGRRDSSTASSWMTPAAGPMPPEPPRRMSCPCATPGPSRTHPRRRPPTVGRSTRARSRR